MSAAPTCDQLRPPLPSMAEIEHWLANRHRRAVSAEELERLLAPLDEPERELMRQELAPVPCPPVHHCPNVAVMRIALQPFGPWQNICAECLEMFQAAYENRGERFPWHLSSLDLAASQGQP